MFVSVPEFTESHKKLHMYVASPQAVFIAALEEEWYPTIGQKEWGENLPLDIKIVQSISNLSAVG